MIKYQRMWILRVRVRHTILGHGARLRIELADEFAGICRVPDVAGLILDQPVRAECPGFSGYSLIWPLPTSSRPSTFAICPVYQMAPS